MVQLHFGFWKLRKGSTAKGCYNGGEGSSSPVLPLEGAWPLRHFSGCTLWDFWSKNIFMLFKVSQFGGWGAVISGCQCNIPPPMDVPKTTLSFLYIYLFYLYYYCVFGGGGRVLSVCCLENRTTHGSRFSPSTMWVSGIELRLSGLMAMVTSWAILCLIILSLPNLTVQLLTPLDALKWQTLWWSHRYGHQTVVASF